MGGVTMKPAEPGMHWSASALCAQVDPALFFPARGHAAPEARQICMGCPVRAECLADALSRNEPSGVWGGLSVRERNKLRRQVAA